MCTGGPTASAVLRVGDVNVNSCVRAITRADPPRSCLVLAHAPRWRQWILGLRVDWRLTQHSPPTHRRRISSSTAQASRATSARRCVGREGRRVVMTPCDITTRFFCAILELTPQQLRTPHTHDHVSSILRMILSLRSATCCHTAIAANSDKCCQKKSSRSRRVDWSSEPLFFDHHTGSLRRRRGHRAA